MEFKISAEIINEAEKCRHNFSCLSGEDECMCEVEDCFNDRIHFIKPEKNGLCDYKMSFGYSYICNCPVRKEIFNLYKK